MTELAKGIGKVIEVIYDPKESQKRDYIRAKVLYDTSRSARDEKILNLPNGESVVISYEYEQVRKKCFHCFGLTHERSQCPLLKQGSKPKGQDTPVSSTKVVTTHMETHRLLEGPPGFPPLFPELSKEARKMALLYVSHSDDTERRARIQRVQMEIDEEKRHKDKELPKISFDMNKEKGLVFEYEKEGVKLKRIDTGKATMSIREEDEMEEERLKS